MYKRLFILTAMALIFCTYSFAEVANKTSTQKAADDAVLTEKKQKQQLLAAQVQELDNKQARAIVLQQLLNEEVSELRQQQLLFCDIYKLDVEKWRKGLYQYDPKLEVFVEKPTEEKKS